MKKAGRTIIMAGCAGSARAREILESRRGEICGRYPVRYLEDGERMLTADITLTGEFDKASLSKLICDVTVPESGSEDEKHVPLLAECGKHGVFEGLWKLGCMADCGISVEQYDIPVLQIAIELCDFADENVYEADSAGVFLFITENAGQALQILENEGIRASVIGYTTDNNDRTVRNGENVRFLNIFRT